MKRRKKTLTQEQIDFRNNILRKKVLEVKLKPSLIIEDVEVRKSFYYINNCVYWINEYIDGKADKKKLLVVAKVLQDNGKKLEADVQRQIDMRI